MSVVTELRRDKDLQVSLGDEARPQPTPPAWRRRRFGMAALAVVVVLVGAVVVNWLLDRWSHIAINDSRVAATLVTVSSEVNGRVLQVPVVGGDAIRSGATLVSIDRSQTELELAGLDAQIVSTAAQQDQLRAQQKMIRTQVARKLEAGRAQIAAAEATHKAAEAVLLNARSHFDRVKALTGRKVVAAQDLEEAQAQLTTAEQQERAAAAGIATAEANLAVTEAEATEVAVLDRQIAMLDAQKSAQIAERDRKRIDIARGTIQAGLNGVIDSTFVDPGEYVSPGTRLLIYHDPNSVWVDANVKETEFRKLRIGAPATITVDAYPGREFTGKVTRLGEAATSQFALLPSPNPSGNFTKVTQRLPIRVSIDQTEGMLRPGMMVEVSVDVLD